MACCGTDTNGGVPAGGGTVASIAFSLPPSDPYPFALEQGDGSFHLRRALVGHTLSRKFVTFVQGGTTFAFSFEGGLAGSVSRATPPIVGTHAFVDLGAVAQTGAQVATLLAIVMLANGVTGIGVAGDEVSIVDATGFATGAPRQNDNELSGMYGFQRGFWGASQTNLSMTPAVANILIQIDSPGAALGRTARILGMHVMGQFNAVAFQPRLALASGPAFSTNPGLMTILAQGRVAASITAGNRGVVIFDEPVEVASGDSLWLIWRANAGDVGFRQHVDVPAGPGDFVPTQNILVDTTASADPTVAFGATFTPVVASNLTVYTPLGMIFEVQDASGDYPGDGALDIWVGDQNDDPTHGTQTTAGPGVLDLETLHFRFPVPQWQAFSITQARSANGAWAPDDDEGFCFYQWPDLNVPATVAPTLLLSGGRVGISAANAYNTVTLGTPLQLGTDAIGANRTVSYGVNFGRVSIGAITTLTAVFGAENGIGAGENGGLNLWGDEGQLWHDYVPAGGGGFGSAAATATEYRTQGTNGSIMPTRNPAAVWPDPFDVDSVVPTDNVLANWPLQAMRYIQPGIVAV